MSLANQAKRQAPKFEDQANVEEVNQEETVQPEGNEVVTSVDDIFNAIINKPKEKPKKQISVYLDEDVAKEFEKFGKKYGKGAKSELVNTFLKSKLITNR